MSGPFAWVIEILLGYVDMDVDMRSSNLIRLLGMTMTLTLMNPSHGIPTGGIPSTRHQPSRTRLFSFYHPTTN